METKKKMKMPKIWLISDCHFYHFNIIRYCHRPYKTVEEMNEDIIQKWNDTVSPEDTVWNLGDFAFFTKKDHDKICKLIQRLNGKIHLLLGNHDRHVCNNLRFWYDLGFEKVIDKPFLFMDQYILSHEPLITKNKIDLTYHPKLKNIYGHVHNSNADFYALTPEQQKEWNSKNPDIRTIPDVTKHWFNVSIEVINYKPIQFDEVIERMKKA